MKHTAGDDLSRKNQNEGDGEEEDWQDVSKRLYEEAEARRKAEQPKNKTRSRYIGSAFGLAMVFTPITGGIALGIGLLLMIIFAIVIPDDPQ